ncbi:hypothetical protein Esti_006593 [Eimeria stiedai]
MQSPKRYPMGPLSPTEEGGPPLQEPLLAETGAHLCGFLEACKQLPSLLEEAAEAAVSQGPPLAYFNAAAASPSSSSAAAAASAASMTAATTAVSVCEGTKLDSPLRGQDLRSAVALHLPAALRPWLQEAYESLRSLQRGPPHFYEGALKHFCFTLQQHAAANLPRQFWAFCDPHTFAASPAAPTPRSNNSSSSSKVGVLVAAGKVKLCLQRCALRVYLQLSFALELLGALTVSWGDAGNTATQQQPQQQQQSFRFLLYTDLSQALIEASKEAIAAAEPPHAEAVLRLIMRCQVQRFAAAAAVAAAAAAAQEAAAIGGCQEGASTGASAARLLRLLLQQLQQRHGVSAATETAAAVGAFVAVASAAPVLDDCGGSGPQQLQQQQQAELLRELLAAAAPGEPSHLSSTEQQQQQQQQKKPRMRGGDTPPKRRHLFPSGCSAAAPAAVAAAAAGSAGLESSRDRRLCDAGKQHGRGSSSSSSSSRAEEQQQLLLGCVALNKQLLQLSLMLHEALQRQTAATGPTAPSLPAAATAAAAKPRSGMSSSSSGCSFSCCYVPYASFCVACGASSGGVMGGAPLHEQRLTEAPPREWLPAGSARLQQPPCMCNAAAAAGATAATAAAAQGGGLLLLYVFDEQESPDRKSDDDGFPFAALNALYGLPHIPISPQQRQKEQLQASEEQWTSLGLRSSPACSDSCVSSSSSSGSSVAVPWAFATLPVLGDIFTRLGLGDLWTRVLLQPAAAALRCLGQQTHSLTQQLLPPLLLLLRVLLLPFLRLAITLGAVLHLSCSFSPVVAAAAAAASPAAAALGRAGVLPPSGASSSSSSGSTMAATAGAGTAPSSALLGLLLEAQAGGPLAVGPTRSLPFGVYGQLQREATTSLAPLAAAESPWAAADPSASAAAASMRVVAAEKLLMAAAAAAVSGSRAAQLVDLVGRFPLTADALRDICCAQQLLQCDALREAAAAAAAAAAADSGFTWGLTESIPGSFPSAAAAAAAGAKAADLLRSYVRAEAARGPSVSAACQLSVQCLLSLAFLGVSEAECFEVLNPLLLLLQQQQQQTQKHLCFLLLPAARRTCRRMLRLPCSSSSSSSTSSSALCCCSPAAFSCPRPCSTAASTPAAAAREAAAAAAPAAARARRQRSIEDLLLRFIICAVGGRQQLAEAFAVHLAADLLSPSWSFKARALEQQCAGLLRPLKAEDWGPPLGPSRLAPEGGPREAPIRGARSPPHSAPLPGLSSRLFPAAAAGFRSSSSSSRKGKECCCSRRDAGPVSRACCICCEALHAAAAELLPDGAAEGGAAPCLPQAADGSDSSSGEECSSSSTTSSSSSSRRRPKLRALKGPHSTAAFLMETLREARLSKCYIMLQDAALSFAATALLCNSSSSNSMHEQQQQWEEVPSASQASVWMPSQVEGPHSPLPFSLVPSQADHVPALLLPQQQQQQQQHQQKIEMSVAAASRGYWPEEQVPIEAEEAQQIGRLPPVLAAAVSSCCSAFAAAAPSWELEPRHRLCRVRLTNPLGGPPLWLPLAQAAVLLVLKQQQQQQQQQQQPQALDGAEMLREEGQQQQQQQQEQQLQQGLACGEIAAELQCAESLVRVSLRHLLRERVVQRVSSSERGSHGPPLAARYILSRGPPKRGEALSATAPAAAPPNESVAGSACSKSNEIHSSSSNIHSSSSNIHSSSSNINSSSSSSIYSSSSKEREGKERASRQQPRGIFCSSTAHAATGQPPPPLLGPPAAGAAGPSGNSSSSFAGDACEVVGKDAAAEGPPEGSSLFARGEDLCLSSLEPVAAAAGGPHVPSRRRSSGSSSSSHEGLLNESMGSLEGVAPSAAFAAGAAAAGAGAAAMSPTCEAFILDFLRDRASRMSSASAKAAPTALILMRLRQQEIEGPPGGLRGLLRHLELLEAQGKIKKSCGNWQAVD